MAAREALARVGLESLWRAPASVGLSAPPRVRLAGRRVRLTAAPARSPGAAPRRVRRGGRGLPRGPARRQPLGGDAGQYGTALGHFVSWVEAAHPWATCADLDHALADAFVGHLRALRSHPRRAPPRRPHRVPVRHRAQALRPLGRPRAALLAREPPGGLRAPRLRRGGDRPLHPGSWPPCRRLPARRPLHGPAPAGHAPGRPGHRDAPGRAAPADGADARRGHRPGPAAGGDHQDPPARARCTCSGRPWRPSAPGSPRGTPSRAPAGPGPLFCDLRGRRLSDGAMDRLAVRLRARSGVARFRWHLLRHTAGTESLRNGADSLDVQEALGHTSPMMTRRYLHLTDDDRRERHARYSPVEALLGPPAPSRGRAASAPGTPAPRCGSRGAARRRRRRLSAGVPARGRRAGPRATGGGVSRCARYRTSASSIWGVARLRSAAGADPAPARGLRGGAAGGEDAQHLGGLRAGARPPPARRPPAARPAGPARRRTSRRGTGGPPAPAPPAAPSAGPGPPARTGRPGRAGPP